MGKRATEMSAVVFGVKGAAAGGDAAGAAANPLGVQEGRVKKDDNAKLIAEVYESDDEVPPERKYLVNKEGKQYKLGEGSKSKRERKLENLNRAMDGAALAEIATASNAAFDECMKMVKALEAKIRKCEAEITKVYATSASAAVVVGDERSALAKDSLEAAVRDRYDTHKAADERSKLEGAGAAKAARGAKVKATNDVKRAERSYADVLRAAAPSAVSRKTASFRAEIGRLHAERDIIEQEIAALTALNNPAMRAAIAGRKNAFLNKQKAIDLCNANIQNISTDAAEGAAAAAQPAAAAGGVVDSDDGGADGGSDSESDRERAAGGAHGGVVDSDAEN